MMISTSLAHGSGMQKGVPHWALQGLPIWDDLKDCQGYLDPHQGLPILSQQDLLPHRWRISVRGPLGGGGGGGVEDGARSQLPARWSRGAHHLPPFPPF